MNFNFESIGLMLLATFYSMGKPQLQKYLQDLHDKNEAWYKAAIFTANAGVQEGNKAAAKTATQLDDAALADIQDTLVTSAKANGITL